MSFLISIWITALYKTMRAGLSRLSSGKLPIKLDCKFFFGIMEPGLWRRKQPSVLVSSMHQMSRKKIGLVVLVIPRGAFASWCSVLALRARSAAATMELNASLIRLYHPFEVGFQIFFCLALKTGTRVNKLSYLGISLFVLCSVDFLFF